MAQPPKKPTLTSSGSRKAGKAGPRMAKKRGAVQTDRASDRISDRTSDRTSSQTPKRTSNRPSSRASDRDLDKGKGPHPNRKPRQGSADRGALASDGRRSPPAQARRRGAADQAQKPYRAATRKSATPAAHRRAGPAAPIEPSAFEGERIAKLMARSGVCSRREAEQWILAGRVSVDGTLLTSPAVNIRAGQDIRIDGKPLVAPDPPRLWRFHKPTGRVTSARDPQGRPTIYADLPADLPRLLPIGRLDINTEGLLLLTNDGALKRYLELPDTGWQRRYRVRAFGRPDVEALEALKRGITIDGLTYRGIHAEFERQQGNNAWLTVSLREGKNREIKKVLAHLGLTVNRLIRLSFGPFQLGNLASAQVEEVPRRILRQQLGAKWHDFADGYDALTKSEGPSRTASQDDRKNTTKRRRP